MRRREFIALVAGADLCLCQVAARDRARLRLPSVSSTAPRLCRTLGLGAGGRPGGDGITPSLVSLLAGMREGYAGGKTFFELNCRSRPRRCFRCRFQEIF